MSVMSGAASQQRDDARREVARQLRITNAAFPSLRLTEEAVMAYTEALDMYPADTIAEAFRVARTDADRNQQHHPRPAEVRRYAALYAKQRTWHQKPGPDEPSPYCQMCLTRTLYDDGTRLGRFSIAHAEGCAQHEALPPNARLWVQNSTPLSFTAQMAELKARHEMGPRPATATATAVLETMARDEPQYELAEIAE